MQVVDLIIKNISERIVPEHFSAPDSGLGLGRFQQFLTTLKEALVQFRRKLPVDLAQICTQGSTQEGRRALTSTGTDDQKLNKCPQKALA